MLLATQPCSACKLIGKEISLRMIFNPHTKTLSFYHGENIFSTVDTSHLGNPSADEALLAVVGLLPAMGQHLANLHEQGRV